MRGPTAFLHFLFPAVYGVISLPRSSIFFSVRLGWDTVGPPLLPLPASFWEAPPATFSYEDNADSPTENELWEAPPATFRYEDNADSPTYLPTSRYIQS